MYNFEEIMHFVQISKCIGIKLLQEFSYDGYSLFYLV